MVRNTSYIFEEDSCFEEAFLGVFLLDDREINLLIDGISSSAFCIPLNKKIWNAMYELKTKGLNIDVITVKYQLLKNNPEIVQLKNDDGSDYIEMYLLELANNVPSCKNISSYAKIMKDRSVTK
jgi:replicative DNA helicase